MTTGVTPEPSSYRDPSSKVYHLDGRILRGLDATKAEVWDRLKDSTTFARLASARELVGTKQLDSDDCPAELAARYARVLEHENVPFVSYPYEWPFTMLQDAARTHLDVLLAALNDGLSLSDGTAYNIQWFGTTPSFIDLGSFEAPSPGPWPGYRQFCQTFLYPLMLEAHLGVPFQPFLVGQLDGFQPEHMRRLLSGRHRFDKGVFRHVYVHSLAEGRVQQGGQSLKADLGESGFGLDLSKALAENLRKLINNLQSDRADSAWSSYRQTCTYSDQDRTHKLNFVRAASAALRPQLAFDLGANDGAYARVVAENAGYVVAADADDVTVDAMYRSLREDGVKNVLPLVMNLVDQSPARGWNASERLAFGDRGKPDLVLALALLHHLVLGANVPLEQVVAWLASLGGDLIVEFVEPDDPMAVSLLSRKPKNLFPDYRVDVFERILEQHFHVHKRERLPSGTRMLYHGKPRTR